MTDERTEQEGADDAQTDAGAGAGDAAQGAADAAQGTADAAQAAEGTDPGEIEQPGAGLADAPDRTNAFTGDEPEPTDEPQGD